MDDSGVMFRLRRSPQVLLAVRAGLGALIVGGFLLALWAQVSGMRDYRYRWQVVPAYLVLAALAALGRGVTVVYPWWRIIRAWGYHLGWGRAVRLYFHSGLARYLPGQWWFVLGRAYLADKEGVPVTVTAASTAMETVLLTGSALAVALIGMATIRQLAGYGAYLALAGVTTIATLLFSPLLVARFVNWLFARMGRAGIATALSRRDTMAVLLGCFANWLIYGLIALLLRAGLGGEEYVSEAAGVVGLFSASVLGGSLGLLVPQGLVIREGVLVYLFSTLLGVPLPLGVAVAALTRLFAMVAEGVWAAISLRF